MRANRQYTDMSDETLKLVEDLLKATAGNKQVTTAFLWYLQYIYIISKLNKKWARKSCKGACEKRRITKKTVAACNV